MRALPLLLLVLAACDGGPADKDASPVDSVTSADSDGDGYPDDEDCAPEDATVHPDRTELCDGIDNDCDGDIDEELGSDWYADEDGDGFGDPDAVSSACEKPEGTVPNGNDCDDADDEVFPSASESCDGVDEDCDGEVDEGLGEDWYQDLDGDGYGDAEAVMEACEAPAGFVDDDSDCDDAEASAYPGAAELCDGVDNDCDGEVDEDAEDAETVWRDVDEDGFGDPLSPEEACAVDEGYADNEADCDDRDAEVNPEADELCDGVDNDCDDEVDEDEALDALTWYEDADGDGWGDASTAACEAPSGYVADEGDCDDGDAGISPDAEELCDGVDNDCDGEVDEDEAADALSWYEDADGDGWGDSDSSTVACEAPSGYVADAGDCDESDAGVNPDAAEVCDGDDEDCDGVADDGVLGTGAACPAVDCAEVLSDDPSAADGDYSLELPDGTVADYTCDMTTDGGGWTLVKDAAEVWGTGYDATAYNDEGFTWTEVLFAYDSGEVYAHCSYPYDLATCNNLTFQFGSASWGIAERWGSTICGMTTSDYTSATDYPTAEDFIISRSSSTDTVAVATLEGVADCTTWDNYGTAWVDVLLRR